MVWWQYLLLVNVYLLLFYSFYALLLRSETFFRLNRIYLVGSAILSFVIPVIQTDWVRNLFITQKLNQTIYHLDTVTITASPQQADTGINLGQILGAIYLIGMAILLLRLILQLLRLKRAFNNNVTGDAFSFFGKVKINEALSEQQVIAAHEDIHSRQWHSADVLLIEFVAIINWFNPVVHLYRKAIKHIHEFIADNEIISRGTAKQDYAMLLLSQTFKTPVNQLANSFFNHSLLKQRIMMLHKNPSQRKALLKYGLSAPLFALMVILSSATAKTTKVISTFNNKAAQVLEIKAMVKAESNPVIKTTTMVNQTPASTKQQAALTTSAPALKHDIVLVLAADTTKKSMIYTSVQQSAQPAGGMKGFYDFLGRNIHYPDLAKANNVQGRVIIQFVVEEDGALSNLRVVRGLGSGCDEEAVRVLSISPKWDPGKQDGQVVRQQYTIPISFALNDMPKVNPASSGKNPPPVPGKIKVTDIVINPIDTIKTLSNERPWPKGVPLYINDKLVNPDSLKHISSDNISSVYVLGPTRDNPNAKKEIRVKTKN